MEGKQHTQSIIVKLMGLEELPYKLPLLDNKKRRVFSENYLQKTASIGLREKSSILVGRSTRIITPKHQRVVKVFKTQMPTSISTKTTVGDTMRSLQNIKVNESLDLKAEAMRLRSSSLLNNTREDYFLHSFANKSFLSKESKKQIIDERWKATQYIEVGYKNHTLGEMSALAELEARPQCMDSKHEKQCFSHIRSLCSCSPLCISGKDGSKYEHSRISPLDSRVAFGISKNNIDNKTSRYGCQLRKKENVDGKDSKPSYLNQKIALECRDLSFILDKSSGLISPCISSAYLQPGEVNKMIDDEKEIILEKNSLYRSSKYAAEAPHCSNISLGNAVADANAGNIKNSSRTTDQLQSKPNISHSYIESGNTCIISIGQESWNKTHETGALSTTVDPNFHHNLRETNQTSPSSVLEQPFKEEKLCAYKMNYRHADLCSVAMQLELLDSNSEETYSEGSEMAVSSNDLCQENKEILIDFNTEESRDYSYLVDVLDEVTLTVLKYNIWNSTECSINSSVFDMLEKKYGKQKSWPKLDRKLLFDIINSGLSEIMHSFMDIYTTKRSLKKRYHFMLRKNEVEEELWKMLVSPKKEVCKDLSDKALGNGTRWLKVEEEINTICREIESFLFEELAAELAYY